MNHAMGKSSCLNVFRLPPDGQVGLSGLLLTLYRSLKFIEKIHAAQALKIISEKYDRQTYCYIFL